MRRMTVRDLQSGVGAGAGIIGIDLGGTKCHGALADMSGAIVAEELLRTEPGRAYENVLACATALRRTASARGWSLAALSLGVPAVVEPGSGRVFAGPNVGWHDFALGERLMRDLCVPLSIENDSGLAAVGEARRGAARGVRDFAVVSIGTGIGAAIVADGRLIKGSHNAAGEIGAMVLHPAQLREPPPGGVGWFESTAGGPALVPRAIRLLEERGEASASQLDASALTPEAVLTAARRGDAVAGEVVARVLDDLAIGLIALATILDPEVVIVDGGVGRALHDRVDGLLERIAPHVASAPTVTVSSLQPTATVVGALVVAREIAFREAPANFGTLARTMVLGVRPGPEQGR